MCQTSSICIPISMWDKKAVQKKIYLSQKTAIPPDVDTYSSQRIKSLENQLFRLKEEMEKRGACQLKKEKNGEVPVSFPKVTKKSSHVSET